jgi:hypothetical protein
VACSLQRSRVALVGVLLGYFVLLRELGGHRSWGKLGVSPFEPSFADLRNLTSAWDCTRQGIAVLPVDPCDFDNRPANYPRLWLLPYHLGLRQGATVGVGVIVAAVFLAAAVAVLPGAASWLTTLIYATVLCSPAAMLGVERGNVDLLIFAVVVVAVLVYRRGLLRLIIADGLLLLAACLKLFPIFAFGFSVFDRQRRAVIGVVAVVGGFVVYLVAIEGQLQQIRKALPQEDIFSYGVRRLSQWLSAATEGASATRASLPAWDALLIFVTAVGALLVARWLRQRLAIGVGGAAGTRDRDLFWAGACVYVGTYALARNYDYRLIFCLLTVPQLVRWIGGGVRFAWVAVSALIGTMWLDGFFSWFLARWLSDWSNFTAVGPNHSVLPLAVVAQFILCFTFVCLLTASAPWPSRFDFAALGRPVRTRELAGLSRD